VRFAEEGGFETALVAQPNTIKPMSVHFPDGLAAHTYLAHPGGALLASYPRRGRSLQAGPAARTHFVLWLVRFRIKSSLL
jgi:hypothetical protein